MTKGDDMVKMVFSMLAVLIVVRFALAEFPHVPICGYVVGEQSDGCALVATSEMLGRACRIHAETNEFGVITEIGGTLAREFIVQKEANALADAFAADVVKTYGIVFDFSTLDDGRHNYSYRRGQSYFSVLTRGNCQTYADGPRKHFYTVEFNAKDYSLFISKVMRNIGGVDVRQCDYDEVVKTLRTKPAVAEALCAMSNLMSTAGFETIPDGVSVGGYRFGEFGRAEDMSVGDCFYISHDDSHVLKGDNLSTLGCFPEDMTIRTWPYELDDICVYDRAVKGEVTPISGRLFLLRFCEMHPETAFGFEEALTWASKIRRDIEKETGETFVQSKVNTNKAEQIAISYTNATLRFWINVSLREDMRDMRIDVMMDGRRVEKEKPKRVCVKVQVSDARLLNRAKQEANILQEAAHKVRVSDVADDEIISACRAIEVKRYEKLRGNPAKAPR